MSPAETKIRSRVRSAVWGGALAIALMATTALPWERGVLAAGQHVRYVTLWQIREGATAPAQRLSDVATLTLILLAALVVLTLAAAAEASGGTALAAGIVAVLAAGAQVLWWLHVNAANAGLGIFGVGPVAADTGLQAALAVTIVIAVSHVPLGIVRCSKASRGRRSGGRDVELDARTRHDLGL